MKSLLKTILFIACIIKLSFSEIDFFKENIKIYSENNGEFQIRETICEKEPQPNCGTGQCRESKTTKEGFICVCPKEHEQKNSTQPCKGVYIGILGGEHPCKDGISSEDIRVINSRMIHIEDLHCDKRILNCIGHLQHAYFMAEMGTRTIRLKTVHFDKCTGTALPGVFPTSIYLEFPEDWYVDAMYRLTLHDLEYDSKICYVATNKKIRDKLAMLDHPDETKCHHQNSRVSIGRFGQKQKCQNFIHSGEIEIINSRIAKVNRFHCDGDEIECHRLLEGAFFVAKRGKNSVFMRPIVHDLCSGYTLPQFQFSFTIFLELPEHWSFDTLSSFLLWDFNTKKVLCRIIVDEDLRRLIRFLPISKKSHCHWEHEALHNDL